MDRTQKWMGSVGCLGQIENIKRQSLLYFIVIQSYKNKGSDNTSPEPIIKTSASNLVRASESTAEASDACNADVVHYSHVILDNRIGCTQKFFSDLHFVSFKEM